MVALFLYLKGMTGALVPISYLVKNIEPDLKVWGGKNALAYWFVTDPTDQ
jgi:hypothetical protein